MAIYRDGSSLRPEGDTVIAEGDEVFFLAARDDIRRAMAEMRHGDTAARRVMIAGGGNIGFRLAKTLEKSNQVKLIERDPRRARKISELLEHAIVLHGRRRGRGAADRGEHRQHGRVRRAHQLRGGQHPVGHARQAPRRAQGDGAHQQALLHRAGGVRQHRHRHLAPDHHHRLAARLRAPRRRGARARAAARRRRGAGGDRARR